MKRLLCLAVLALPGCDPARLGDVGPAFTGASAAMMAVPYAAPPPATIIQPGPLGTYTITSGPAVMQCVPHPMGTMVCY